jgi:hypothetical protein
MEAQNPTKALPLQVQEKTTPKLAKPSTRNTITTND